MEKENSAYDRRTTDTIDIRRAVRAINDAWLSGKAEAARAYFHPEAALFEPGFGARVSDRDALIASYQQFFDDAQIHDFRESDFQASAWGTSAVASYQFEMVYALKNGTFRDRGRDTFLFIRENGKWWVTARSVLTTEQVRVG